MSFRFLIALILQLAATSVAAAPSLSLGDLGGSGAYELRMGKGRVNGRAFDVGVLSGFTTPDGLAASLRERFAGKATVTYAPAAFGTVVMIADMKSPQCPACRAPTRATIDAIERESLVISFVALPGAPVLAIGSTVGSLLDPHPMPEIIVYEGTALRKIAQDLHIDAQSVFTFGRGWVGTSLVDAPGNGDETMARIEAALERSGYQPVSPAQNRDQSTTIADAGRNVSLWTNGTRTVGLAWIDSEGGRSKKVVINETFIK